MRTAIQICQTSQCKTLSLQPRCKGHRLETMDHIQDAMRGMHVEGARTGRFSSPSANGEEQDRSRIVGRQFGERRVLP